MGLIAEGTKHRPARLEQLKPLTRCGKLSEGVPEAELSHRRLQQFREGLMPAVCALNVFQTLLNNV